MKINFLVIRCNLNPNTGNLGFSGPNCNTIICDFCLFGTCVSPGVCICDEGYINNPNSTDCAIPTCLKLVFFINRLFNFIIQLLLNGKFVNE